MSGYFYDHDNESFNPDYFGIDIKKAYASCLNDKQFFNVLNLVDKWLPFDNEQIEEYTQYIIELNDGIKRMDIKIAFTQKASRCYGYKFKKIDSIKYKIYFVRNPSKLNKTNSHDYLMKLYNYPNISIKKFIINKNTGLIEQKYNSLTNAGIFKSPDDAHFYMNKYGVTVHYLIKCDNADNGEYHDLTDVNEKLYLHNVSDKKHLHKVFKPIKDLIYEIQTTRNYELYLNLR